MYNTYLKLGSTYVAATTVWKRRGEEEALMFRVWERGLDVILADSMTAGCCNSV
jgi:hypothetical protein